MKLWPNIPSKPGSVQDEIWRAQWKSSSGSWGAAQKMDRRSSGYGRSPALACWFSSSIEYLAHGSPPAWWFLGCVPFSSASGFTLVRLLAQSGTCTGPGRRTQRPAKMRTSPTRLLIIQRRTASCTSGSWVSRPPGWRTACQGLQHLSSSHQSPKLWGWWAACQGPRHLGAAPEPPAFGMGIPARSGRSGFLPSEMTALASR